VFRLFDRYITRILIFHYAGASAVLFGIFIAVDTLFRIDTLSKAEEGLIKTILMYWASSLPQVFVTLAPVAFVVGSISTLTLLKRRNELIAYLSAGSSLWRLLVPFFVMSIFSAALMLIVDLSLLDYASSIWSSLRTDRAVKRLTIADKSGYILRLNKFYPATKRIDDLTILFTNSEGQIVKAIRAKEGNLISGEIELKNCEFEDYDSSGAPIVIDRKEDSMRIKTGLTSEDFEIFEQDLQSLSLFELAQLMKMKPNLPHIKTNFYARIALMMGNFVLLLVCLPFALGVLGRSPFLNLGVVLVICFFYFIISLFFWQLGASGQLAPVSAAWLPNLFFICLGAAIVDLIPN